MSDEKTPYKPAFAKISDEKRQRILDTAISVFAENGFTGANINTIAAEAGVSIGAMYNYFETKEDLFLTVIDHLHDFLEQGLTEALAGKPDFFKAVEAMMRAAVAGAIEYPDHTNVYLNTTAEHIDGLGARLSGKMEGVTLDVYRNLATGAVENGTLPKETDISMLGFLIDNQIVALQRAYAKDYHRARMNLFLDGETDAEGVIRRSMKLFRALTGSR